MRICSGIVCKGTGQGKGGKGGEVLEGMLYKSLVGVCWRTEREICFWEGITRYHTLQGTSPSFILVDEYMKPLLAGKTVTSSCHSG